MDSTFSLNSLVISFREALCALIPIADRLKIPWREPANYEEWDAIANGLFEGFVLISVRNSTDWGYFLPLAAYDKRVNDYAASSFVAATWKGMTAPLVCLETNTSPFDTCLLAQLDERSHVEAYIRVPVDECEFKVVAHTKEGAGISFDYVSF